MGNHPSKMAMGKKKQWGNILFIDESSFSVSAKNGRQFCYRRDCERFIPETICEFQNRGYGYVNVWGGIIGDRRTPLIRIRRTLTAQTYIEDILTDVVLTFIAEKEQHRTCPITTGQCYSP